MKTRKDLINWINQQVNNGNSIPVVTNGGGFSWMRYNVSDIWPQGGVLRYADELEVLEKGKEYPDFAVCLRPEEYENMTFVVLRHQTGYNQENMDIQFGTWDFIDC